MTDRKKFDRSGGHRSLYLGLLNNILIGIFLAIFVYFLVLIPSTYVIKTYYVSSDLQAERHASYVESLQGYVLSEGVDHEKLTCEHRSAGDEADCGGEDQDDHVYINELDRPPEGARGALYIRLEYRVDAKDEKIEPGY